MISVSPFGTIAIISILSASSYLPAQSQWTYAVNQHGFRKTTLQQPSVILGVNCSTRLEFHCTQDSKGATGMLALQFTVFPIAPIKNFDFGYFEGPDAPVGGQKLMKVTLSKAGKQTTYSMRLGGWLSGEIEDGFVFSANSKTRDRSGQIRKVLDQVIQGAESIEVAIIDGKNRSTILKTTFPLIGGKASFEAILKGL